jgi:hypothetical protein
MATWNNGTKDATSFANQAKGASSITWDQANLTWDQAQGTWDNPFEWNNRTKDATSFSNQTKH